MHKFNSDIARNISSYLDAPSIDNWSRTDTNTNELLKIAAQDMLPRNIFPKNTLPLNYIINKTFVSENELINRINCILDSYTIDTHLTINCSYIDKSDPVDYKLADAAVRLVLGTKAEDRARFEDFEPKADEITTKIINFVLRKEFIPERCYFESFSTRNSRNTIDYFKTNLFLTSSEHEQLENALYEVSQNQFYIDKLKICNESNSLQLLDQHLLDTLGIDVEKIPSYVYLSPDHKKGVILNQLKFNSLNAEDQNLYLRFWEHKNIPYGKVFSIGPIIKQISDYEERMFNIDDLIDNGVQELNQDDDGQNKCSLNKTLVIAGVVATVACGVFFYV